MVEPLVVEETFSIINRFGGVISGDVRFQDNRTDLPVVVVCHSFMAFKDWGFFPIIARKIAEHGFAVVTFNFSMNGVAGHGNRITEFDAFASNTFMRELDDLATVLDAITQGQLGAIRLDEGRLALLGHSRGGGIAVLQAARDIRIRALVTWSAISTFDCWTDHQKAKWRTLGYLPLAKDTTRSPLRLGLGLLEEYEQHRSELSIIDAASRIRCPWLVLHGKADVTVPPLEAERLYTHSQKQSTELHLLDHVGHLYNAASESEDGYLTLDRIIHQTVQWLHRTLT